MSAWPINTKNNQDFVLPKELSDYLSRFEAFYTSAYSGRNLRWILPSCTAEVRLLYTDRPYSLVMTALHTATMALFEARDVDQITLDALRTGLLGDSTAASLGTTSNLGGNVTEIGEDVAKKAVAQLAESGFLRLLSPDGLTDVNTLEVTNTRPL